MATVFIDKRYDFSDEELQEKGKELATTLHTRMEILDKRKQEMKNFKDALRLVDVKVDSLRDQVREGFEIIQIECRVEMNPDTGIKRFFNNSTGEFEKHEQMTDDDYRLFNEGIGGEDE